MTVYEISTLLIALCAFALTVQQGLAIRAHNRISVQPKIDMHWNLGVNGKLELRVENKGLGPAIVEEVKLSKTASDPYVVLNSFEDLGCFFDDLIDKTTTKYEYLFIDRGTTLKVGEVSIIFRMDLDLVSPKIQAHLFRCLANCRCSVKYKSMYGERNACVYDSCSLLEAPSRVNSGQSKKGEKESVPFLET